MNQADWLDRVKAETDYTSDYKIAQARGVTRQLMSQYRHEQAPMPDEFCVWIGDQLGIDPMEVIATTKQSRARTQQERKFWSRWAQKVQAAAVSVGAIVVAGNSIDDLALRAAESFRVLYILCQKECKKKLTRIECVIAL